MQLASLHEALGKLDSTNDNHWTQDGLPRLETLKMLTGDQSLTREIVSAQFPDFKRVTVVIQPPVINPPVVHIHHNQETVSDNDMQSAIDILEEVSLEREQEYLAELERAYYDAKAAWETQLKVVDDIILASQNDLSPAEDNQITIMSYLKSQQEDLALRKQKIEMIQQSGIDLKQLAANLKAPIDQKKKRRN